MSENTRILYTMDASPPGRAAMMVIALLGVDVEKKDLNPVRREQDKPEFAKKSPMRTIPLLKDDDFYLGDSHAIILYLIDKYGKSEHSYLYPEDKRKRATINHRLFLNCGILFPRLRAIMAPTYFGRLTELSDIMIANVNEAYEMLEGYLSETAYLADDVLTIADLCVVTTVSTLNGLHEIDKKRYPKLIRWLNKMSEHEVCKRINEPGWRLHVNNLKRKMEINKKKISKL